MDRAHQLGTLKARRKNSWQKRMVHHHHKMYSYAKMNSNLFHFSTPHNSFHSHFTKQTRYRICTTHKVQVHVLYQATGYVAGQQLYNRSVRTDTLYSCCPAMYQSVGETPTIAMYQDSHHSSHSISPNCLWYDLLLLLSSDIVSHWSETCFLLKLCRSIFSPCCVDLLIRAITYRDGRFQLADEIVNVNGASLRYQMDFKHVWHNQITISGVWQLILQGLDYLLCRGLTICFCRGLTMEEARNLLRSCQGEVSYSSLILWV